MRVYAAIVLVTPIKIYDVVNSRLFITSGMDRPTILCPPGKETLGKAEETAPYNFQHSLTTMF
jgi:hypothetical protein